MTSGQGQPGALQSGHPPSQPPPSLDLAFRLEDGQGLPLAPELLPLLQAAGELAGPNAGDHWQTLLAGWLAQLRPQLPPGLVSSAYCLGLQLTDDATVTDLNGQWRQLWQPTDVLSFAAQEAGLEPPPPLPPGEEPELELGDIVISLETAARQAGAGERGLEQELLFLASHGLLHLLGWDHPDDTSLTAMLALQEHLIQGSGGPGGW